jgi:transposase InsO family protein
MAHPHVFAALSRLGARRCHCLPHPQAQRVKSPTAESSVQGAASTLAPLRKAPARTSLADRRQVSTSYPGKRASYWQFTAIDDCTRLRVLKIYERNNQKNACDFVDYVLSRLPFRVQAIQTDNGPEFSAQFHWHMQDLNIAHIYIKKRTPRLNGKVERSHRIDEEEFYQLLEGVIVEDAGGFNTKVQEWENFYNYERPHGALAGQSPYERFREKAQLSS